MFAHTYICLVLALFHFSHALPSTNTLSTHTVSARNGSVEKLDIDGKTYDIERLDDKLQSKESMVYKVVGGYEGTPAVVKMIVDYWHGSANNIEKEVEFTDRVGLRLADGAAKMPDGRDAHALVMKDLRENDPPLKTLPEWYREHENMNLAAVLIKFRLLVMSSLLNLAEEHNMMYKDLSFANLFIDKNITRVTPVDFTLAIPNHLKPEGVKKGKGITEVDDQETKDNEILDYKLLLHKSLVNLLNMKWFKTELRTVGDTMRQVDVNRMLNGADEGALAIWNGRKEAPDVPLYN